MRSDLRCDLCGSTDDVQMIECRIGWGRSVGWESQRPWCASCRTGAHRTWRWADKSKRRSRIPKWKLRRLQA